VQITIHLFKCLLIFDQLRAEFTHDPFSLDFFLPNEPDLLLNELFRLQYRVLARGGSLLNGRDVVFPMLTLRLLNDAIYAKQLQAGVAECLQLLRVLEAQLARDTLQDLRGFI
jgi:hypothetical protein